ncbi:MAG: hypothetical protein WAT09_02030 [Paracoccaceae bacterium]
MFDRIKTLLSRWHEISEVDALTDREVADLSMTRSQLRAFAKMPPDVDQRVAAMGTIFGVPEADLKRDHFQWVDLLSTCGRCADRVACGHALANGDITKAADAGFCPNRGTFALLAPRPD